MLGCADGLFLDLSDRARVVVHKNLVSTTNNLLQTGENCHIIVEFESKFPGLHPSKDESKILDVNNSERLMTPSGQTDS
jgi:hypothetical protein